MKMLQFILLLSFLAVVPSTMQGAMLSKEKIIIKSQGSWCGKGKKVPMLIPIEAYLVNNSYIEIAIISQGNYPFTIQIMDSSENLVYENSFYLFGDDIYTIDIAELVPGEYMLIFRSEYLKVEGTFEKE